MIKTRLVVGLNLLILLFGIDLYAANPTYKYFNNSGGINQKLDDVLIADNECSDCQNVYFDEGAIIKRYGSEKLNATSVSVEVKGLYDFALTSGSRKLIAVNNSGNIYKMDSLDGTFDDVSSTPVLTSGQRIDFATYTLSSTTGTNVCILANGTDEMYYWDGASSNFVVMTEQAGLDSPEAKYIIVFKNRFWAVDKDNLNQIWYTAVNEANDWGNGGVISIDTNDGDKISGLAVIPYSGTDIYDKLVVFKEKSIYLIDADDPTPTNWVISKINSNVGCICRWSIQKVGNALFFLAYDGVYSLEGTTVTKLSTKIDPIIRALNAARLKDASSVILRDYDQYWISVSNGDSTSNNLILVYDYVLNAWFKYSGINAGCLAEVIDPTLSDYRVYSSDYSGYVYRQWYGTNDNTSTAIDAYYTSKRYTFGNIEWLKRVMYLYTYAYASGNWEVNTQWATDGDVGYNSYTINLSPVGSLWGTFVWGTDPWGGDTYIRYREDFDKTCWAIRIKYSNSDANETFKIYGWSFNIQPLEADIY